ncbi:MAG: tRNA (adenosine(37)-N6)-threonylcarbamoyltransferase complex transferase subunit TsaD [Bacteroidia bacterium]|nr:tRNA (adenosine(37)-N6)-threonylcarbamoyltransferase complex transferase subunit TsaD [Bacteroidia bacterium]
MNQDTSGPVILAIESSCDETSAAVLGGRRVLSNIVRSQLQHAAYGGVIPELASRLHQQHIVRVVDQALVQAGISRQALDAVAFTQGPGLMGALMVGASFAKAFAWALDKPLIGVHHMQAHVLAHFLQDPAPSFPFLCLTVSGGHTQLVLVRAPLEMEVVGETLDDAAGEAFDKAAKLLGLPYPGGPLVDQHARNGNPAFVQFPAPDTDDHTFSFSGLKTSLLYYLRKKLQENPDFIQEHLDDICASYQHQVVTILLDKLARTATRLGITCLAISGGVSANSALRARFLDLCQTRGWQGFIPPMAYCTDNAAMIGIVAHYKYALGLVEPLDTAPFARGDFEGV